MKIRHWACLSLAIGSFMGSGHALAEGTVTGFAGVSLSIYPNPWDPNRNFNASETTASYGDGVTGTIGNWVIGSADGKVTHALDRIDGRSFYADVDSSSYIYNVTTASGPSAFLQFTAPAAFTERTLITAQDINFSAFTTPQPFNIKFSTGSPGTTNAAWSSIAPVTSGPGTVFTHPITVVPLYTPINADTMRVTFPSTSSAGSNSQAAIQEVILLPDGLVQLHTSVDTTFGVGYSRDDTAGQGQGIDDNQGGPYTNNVGTHSGIWYDFNTPAANTKFFEINILDPKPINAMVLFGDSYSAGTEYDIFDATNTKIAHVAFDPTQVSELLPIRFDTPVYTSKLRFELTAGPAFLPSNNIATMREVVLLTAPEPASAALLAAGTLLLLRRRKTQQ